MHYLVMSKVCTKHFLSMIMSVSKKRNYINCRISISGLNSHQIQRESLDACYFKIRFTAKNFSSWCAVNRVTRFYGFPQDCLCFSTESPTSQKPHQSQENKNGWLVNLVMAQKVKTVQTYISPILKLYAFLVDLHARVNNNSTRQTQNIQQTHYQSFICVIPTISL